MILEMATSMKTIDLVSALKARIESTTARVGVVGLGYVGLPFVVEKAKVGFSVLGFDRKADRVLSLIHI